MRSPSLGGGLLLVVCVGPFIGLALTRGQDVDAGLEESTFKGQAAKALEDSREHGSTRLEEIAAAFAVRCFGSPKPLASAVETENVRIEKATIPYLNRSSDGRLAVKVTIAGVKLELPSTPPGLHDSFVRTFDILVDPLSNQILELTSRWPGNEAEMPSEPDAESAAEQMTRSGNEVYHSFPVDPPKISFMKVLDTIQRCGGSPLHAKQIVAHYVMWSRLGKWREPRPVWAVTLRGIPPIMPPPGTRADALDKFRFIVDADTGQWLCGSNEPRPKEWTLQPR